MLRDDTRTDDCFGIKSCTLSALENLADGDTTEARQLLVCAIDRIERREEVAQ